MRHLRSLLICASLGAFSRIKELILSTIRLSTCGTWEEKLVSMILALTNICFNFFHLVDMKKMLEGAPWTFNNHLLLLHQSREGEILGQIPIHHVEFWIQVHDLLVGCMSVGIGKQLGDFIGTFLDYDVNNNVGV